MTRKARKYDVKGSFFRRGGSLEYLESSVSQEGGLLQENPVEVSFNDGNEHPKENEEVGNTPGTSVHNTVRQHYTSHDLPIPFEFRSKPVMFNDSQNRVDETINKDQASNRDASYSEWERNELELDKLWYTIDEPGTYMMDDFYEPELAAPPVQEPSLNVSSLSTKPSNRQSQYAQDNDLWELNRMMTGGVTKKRELNEEIDSDLGVRVHVIVKNSNPKFLKGKLVHATKDSVVGTVKDPTSDIAVFARRGSKLVNYRREQKEKRKIAKTLSVAGTTLGTLIGVKDPDREVDDSVAPSNPRESSKFAKHMETQVGGSSDFSIKKTISQQREYLPIFSVREDLLRVIRENQIVVITGETGSGKTTQLTQYLYEDGYCSYGKIACTQPRRVAAMSVAKRVSDEIGTKLGDLVGYSIRFENCCSENTIIKYMTDGVLLRESLNSNDLDQYSAIIIDEAHERALHTDILIGLLKRIVSFRRDMKLIVTSATMNTEKFANFFGGVPIFSIPGRTFPIDIYFDKNPCEDYVESAVRKVLEIHLSQPPGDILVFMTGQEDIDITCEVINERLSQIEGAMPLITLPAYSQLPSDIQAKIFRKAENNTRKVVVATNIAETSLTVDGIVYVIDTGFCKLKIYNPRIGMEILQITPISQANASQRSGRAGRTGPGSCYRLYTESTFFRDLFLNSIPEIQRTSLTNVVLLLKSLKIDNLQEFNFIDPPSIDNLHYSLYQLWIFGAIDNSGFLTPLGKRMVDYPCDPALSKMIISSQELGCSEEIIVCTCVPKGFEEESDSAREKFFVTESDHLTLLHIYKQWQSNNYRDSWCNAHFINPKALKRASEVRAQLIDIIKSRGGNLKSSGNDWDVIRKCVCSAYFFQAAKMNGIGEYINLRTGMSCRLHPTNALYGRGYTPDYIVYHEMVVTSREYMRCVTAMDPYWLVEYGSMFFSIREMHAPANVSNRAASESSSEISDNDSNLEFPSDYIDTKNEKSDNKTDGGLKITSTNMPRCSKREAGTSIRKRFGI